MTLTLRVESLKALTETLREKGQHCFGAVLANDVGKWAIQFYPHGDARARDGACSVFIKNMVLAPGIAAVKIEGNIRIIEHNGSSSNSSGSGNPTIIPSSEGSGSSGNPSESSSQDDGATAAAADPATNRNSGSASSAAAAASSSSSSSSSSAMQQPPPPLPPCDPVATGASASSSPSSSSTGAAATATTTTTTTFASNSSSSSSSSSASGAAATNSNNSGSGSGFLRVTKAFGKSSAFLNPNADGLATSSSWGFHDYCSLADLPESFAIEAEILVREQARHDALALHVGSLTELRKQCPRGQSTLGFVHEDDGGVKWSLCLYPNGDNLSREGQLGVFVKVLALPPGVTAVKIEGNLRVLQAGQILASRSFPVSTFLNPSGTGAATSSTWGFHDFCELGEIQDSFIIEGDITIRERAREPSYREMPEDLSLERLLECVRLAHGREVEEAKNSRRILTEAQLRTLTLDQLLEMQENIANIIREKRTQENECSVCQDRVKAMACVPCGHRFCAECSTKLTQCPECRQEVTQKIRLF